MSSESELLYADGDTPLRGFLHLPGADGVPTPLPGILLIHGGAGLDEHAREQAGRYADLGYAVLAADMFGPAAGAGREQLITTIKALRDDADALVRRASAGISALEGSGASAGCFAAVGFCFGGMAALTLARAGLELAAVVSMHGSLATTRPAQPGAVRARVLACHGARDPHVPMEDVVAFSREMIRAEADWHLLMHGRAVHGFTHRHAVASQIAGVAYDRDADEASFAAARTFLAKARPGTA
jgi:dienelactone hydrolase